MNPLESNQQVFIELMNPNPSSSKTKQGPVYRVSFELQQDDWQLFMDADTKGMRIDCVMQRAEDVPATTAEERRPSKGPYSEFAMWVYQSGVLRAPHIWKSFGSEDDHKKFIQGKKCVICGGADWHEGKGIEVCEEAHVRTAENSGTGFKPPYISVPMCHHDHSIQHNNGYSELYERYCEFHPSARGLRPDLVAEWITDVLKSDAMRYLEDWMKEKLYAEFGITSLTYLKPELFESRIRQIEGHSFSVPDRFLPPEFNGDY